MVDLLRDAHTGASIAMFWGITRAYSLLGDPGGELETTDDLIDYSRRLREQRAVRSRGGFLYSSDYEVCAAILRSPDASADIPGGAP